LLLPVAGAEAEADEASASGAVSVARDTAATAAVTPATSLVSVRPRAGVLGALGVRADSRREADSTSAASSCSADQSMVFREE
jgi:hypothetical protein